MRAPRTPSNAKPDERWDTVDVPKPMFVAGTMSFTLGVVRITHQLLIQRSVYVVGVARGLFKLEEAGLQRADHNAWELARTLTNGS